MLSIVNSIEPTDFHRMLLSFAELSYPWPNYSCSWQRSIVPTWMVVHIFPYVNEEDESEITDVYFETSPIHW